MKQLSLVYNPPPQTAYERARAEARRHARETALATFAHAAETVEMLRDLASFDPEDLTVCVAHDAPICAAKLSADIARMLASVKSNTGRIR